jgi:hypothetical protein
MSKHGLVALTMGAALFCCNSSPVMAEDSVFLTARIIPELRPMIGKPLLEQTIAFSNSKGVVLEAITPEGARFFWGGNGKQPGESADDMRKSHYLVVLLNPCPDAHDMTSKISSISVWEEAAPDKLLDRDEQVRQLKQTGLGLEQLLSIMNTPSAVVTPSTLRTPRVKSLHGPVFEYVRGDTTETLGFLNEGEALRINWTSSNTGVCPH